VEQLHDRADCVTLRFRAEMSIDSIRMTRSCHASPIIGEHTRRYQNRIAIRACSLVFRRERYQLLDALRHAKRKPECHCRRRRLRSFL